MPIRLKVEPTSRPSSIPYMTRKTRFYSTPVQKVYDRTYYFHAAALYQVGVLLRAVGTEAQAARVEEAIDARLEALTNDMQAEVRRLEQVRDDNGIEAQVQYTGPLDIEARISTRRAAVYLGVLELWDRMVQIMDALRLTGIMTDQQFRDGVFVWRQQITRTVIENIGIARRAMIASRKANQETIKAQQERPTRKKPRATAGSGEAGPDAPEAGEEALPSPASGEEGALGPEATDAGAESGAIEDVGPREPTPDGASPDMMVEITDEHLADIHDLANETEDGTPVRKSRRRTPA